MSMVVDPKAKSNGMDLSWLGKPHEYDPRRLYSQTGADWQYRVDFDRLRQERLVKLQAEMKAEDLGALVLFAGANIRYATGVISGQLEIQHQYPLRGGSGRGKADALRDRRVGPAVRQDRPPLDGRAHPSRHHLAVGGRRGAVHGRPHGRQRRRSAEGARRPEGEDRYRQPRHAGLRGIPEGRSEDRQRLAGRVARRASSRRATRSSC